jgi:hypothetical protein
LIMKGASHVVPSETPRLINETKGPVMGQKPKFKGVRSGSAFAKPAEDMVRTANVVKTNMNKMRKRIEFIERTLGIDIDVTPGRRGRR